MKILCYTFLFIIPLISFGQKKTIDHTVYNDWKTLSNEQISKNGKFISYEIKPHKGDGYLYLYNVDNQKLDSFPRGKSAEFSPTGSYLIFKIDPGFDTLRTCELNKVDKKKWPKDSLGIYMIDTDSLIKYDKLKSYTLQEENDWIAVLYDHNELPNMAVKKKKFCKKKKIETPEIKSNGSVLSILNPLDQIEHKIKNITQVRFSKNGSYLAYVSHQKDKVDSMRLFIFHSARNEHISLPKSRTAIDKLMFNEQETQLVFLTSNDTSKAKNHTLNSINLHSWQESILVDTLSESFGQDKAVTLNFAPFFTSDGSLLYFGVSDKIKETLKDSLLESEKVKLDLWHYADKRLQPQQLKELKKDEKRANLFVYRFGEDRIVQLSNDTLHLSPSKNPNGNYLMAMSNEAYAATYNWTIPYPEDHYMVSLQSGEIEPIRKGIEFGGRLSPSGKYYTYFDPERKNHYSIEIQTSDEFCITCEVENAIWQEDVNGMPMKGEPYGIIGWTNDEKEVWVQSEYDIWSYQIQSKEVASLTDLTGINNKIKLRLHRWNRDSIYLDLENIYIQGFNEATKGVHFFSLLDHDDHIDLKEDSYFDANVSGIKRSDDKSRIIAKKMTFSEYPDLYTSSSFAFIDPKKISNTNPQQKEFNWGSVELIKWKSYNGTNLEGLLYKPENFDSTKQYPMLVYFYELYSDRLHQHYIPRPTPSIIYPTEYVSAEYIVFIPDIKYEAGHPAKSAFDCIMSGTDKVLELTPNIDSKRIGLQGQSWGGYQTAQLITMTNRYAAAMAGAPVSNMFSAYGGIRWGSGLNRMFQYEKTQSRIGYTIWEKPELYIENSPLFHLPKVETPLLIMHNDEDGAVPWYQGIELFTGMKRLNKKVWLLNYNGDDHNLMVNANRVDLSIRMRQFFDHYLKMEEAPQWLLDGIPAIVKGTELRY